MPGYILLDSIVERRMILKCSIDYDEIHNYFKNEKNKQFFGLPRFEAHKSGETMKKVNNKIRNRHVFLRSCIFSFAIEINDI